MIRGVCAEYWEKITACMRTRVVYLIVMRRCKTAHASSGKDAAHLLIVGTCCVK